MYRPIGWYVVRFSTSTTDAPRPTGPRSEIRRVLTRNIRALAKKKRIKLKHLADFAGTTPSQLFRVLRGETSPSVRWLVKVANVLEVEPWVLLAPSTR